MVFQEIIDRCSNFIEFVLLEPRAILEIELLNIFNRVTYLQSPNSIEI